MAWLMDAGGSQSKMTRKKQNITAAAATFPMEMSENKLAELSSESDDVSISPPEANAMMTSSRLKMSRAHAKGSQMMTDQM